MLIAKMLTETMNKENVLFGIIGLLVGLIVGFTATNYVNRSDALQKATAVSPPQQLPQVNNQVVRDQVQTGGKTGNAALPQVQEKIDRADGNPNDFAAQVEAGKMYYRIKGFDKAAQYFEKANLLNPNDYETIVNLGNVYYDKGETAIEAGSDGTADFQISEKWYLRALAKKPDDVNVRTDLGLTFFLRAPKNIDRAIQEYRQSLEINPNHEPTLQNLASAFKEKGDLGNLSATLSQLQKVNPNNPAVVQSR